MRRILHHKQKNRGFTLIEVLLYVGIAGILLSLVVYFLFTVIQSRVKNQAIIEVEEQGLLIMDLMHETVQKARSVNSPGFGVQSSELSLAFTDPSHNPTIFRIVDNNLTVQRGTTDPVILNSDNIKFTNFRITNSSRTGTTGLFRIQFDVSYNNLSGRNEFNYSQTFYSSVTLRQRRP